MFFVQFDLNGQIDLSLSKKAKIGSVKLSGALNDFNGNANSISILFQPQFGTVEIANDGCMFYFPDSGSGEEVSDSFTYQICANNDPGDCRQVETRVQIGDGNDFFACQDGYRLEPNTIFALDVLENDINADPSTLDVILAPINGTFADISISNGQIIFETSNYQGQTEFLYSVQSAVDGSSDVVKVSLLIGNSNDFVAVADCRYVIPGTTVLEGEAVCYQIDVNNSGGTTATGVTVQDILPSALGFISSEPNGEYSAGSGNWIVPDIAPGETETLTITATVNQGGNIENCAQVTAADQSDGDSTPNNNIATEDDQDCALIIVMMPGCTDQCAPNFNPQASEEDGSCEDYSTDCNTDCLLGDIEVWNPNTCQCEVDIATVLGCTDPTATNYNSAANCNDDSCVFPPDPMVDYIITQTPDGCYQISLVPNQDWIGTAGITSTAQVTLVVASDGFVLNNFTSVNGVWSNNSTILNPAENPDFEYYTFGLVGLGTTDITYIEGQEEVLFTFCNSGECTSSILLMENDDPFSPPNSEGVNVGNQLTTLGSGNVNAWFANQGGIIEECTAAGCIDPCAPNFDATADEDDGSCEPYDMTCNTDCTLGDLEEWDAATCSCEVTERVALGCTDVTACNYDAMADCEDGSCTFAPCNPGCTDPCAANFDSAADEDDGSCEAYDMTCNTDCTLGDLEEWNAATCSCEITETTVNGCTDPAANNFDSAANCDDDSCIFEVFGCTDPCAPNYNATADEDDGSCEIYDTTCNSDCTLGDITEWDATTCSCEIVEVSITGCTLPTACNYNPDANCEDGSCALSPCNPGCTDPCASNYDAIADADDGSCEAYDSTCNTDCTLGDLEIWNPATCSCEIETTTVSGCDDPDACNYDAAANCNDESCTYFPCILGCTDPCAPNYDATAEGDDGSCEAYDTTCNTDCTLGDLEEFDESTCSCEVVQLVNAGCTDPDAMNFVSIANCDDGSCVFANPGCTNPCSPNFDPDATEDDGSCIDAPCNPGCTDQCAVNFDPDADADDGSCAPYDTSICNSDCDLGDLEIWDTETCSCIPDPINNCNDTGNGIGVGSGDFELCQNFTAIDAVLCEVGALDYHVLISISGGAPGPDGYIITDNNTGVVFGPFISNTLILGPYEVPTGYSFTVAVANNSSCSEVLELSAVDCQTTAIELLRFDGQIEDNGNDISWTTASEKDSKLFIVQHSTNGVDFAKVGSINAMGNSNESNDYNFLHENVEAGTHYYRLSEVDVFGTERIVTDVIALNRNSDLQIVQLYPVPTQTFVNLEFVADIEQQVVVKIFDITGRIITEQTTLASKGQNQVRIDARNYSAGNYFIQISGNDTSFVKRFAKQ